MASPVANPFSDRGAHEMRIYIDEAGPFVVPPPSREQSFSLVLALTIPSSIEDDLFYEFLRVRDTWANNSVEVKGSTLDESQATQLINLLRQYELLVDFFALDMVTHNDSIVDDFRKRQAENVTANITPAHHPHLAAQLSELACTIRDMPNQLFLQAFLTITLILRVAEEATAYFAQRLPAELGELAWVIDRKNRTVTEMEEMWTRLILPASESYFGKSPFKTLEGADYSHFHARYGITLSTADEETLRHLQWVQSIHGGHPITGNDQAVDARRLYAGSREFLDSRISLGLQLADMAASILRRALNNRLQFQGWQNFGGLLIRRSQRGSYFVQLGGGDPAPRLKGHAAKVCRMLDAHARSMLLVD